jgi:hypothetical protein
MVFSGLLGILNFKYTLTINIMNKVIWLIINAYTLSFVLVKIVTLLANHRVWRVVECIADYSG